MIKFIIHFVLEIILLCLLVFNSINISSSSLPALFAFLLVFLIVICSTTRYRYPLNKQNRDVLFIVVGISITFIGVLYFGSFFSGYDTNFNYIFNDYIPKITWILTFLTIGLTEIIRYYLTIVDYHREKYNILSKVIMFINYILIDFIIIGKSYSLNTLPDLYDFFGLFLIQSISKNLLLNYMSTHYGFSSCLWYRFIVELYVYIIPIIPRINLLIRATVFFVFPYIVFLLVKHLTEKRKKKKYHDSGVISRISTLIFSMIFLILVLLVSCEFKYAMIAVGSESMSGTINKGDAIIYEVIEDDSFLTEGDIIVFMKNETLIVHRIYKVYSMNGKNKVYQTKGDNNSVVDNWIVNKEDIIGVVKLRVLMIAWPSVLLNEWFS